MSYTIDTSAPIIPGQSAAGLNLGVRLEAINNSSLEKLKHSVQPVGNANEIAPWHVYASEDLYLRFVDGVLTTIGVMGSYKGTTPHGLGIGDKVADFEAVFGNLIEGTEDELTFERVEGQLWFEVNYTGCNSENWRELVRTRSVSALYLT